MIKIDIIQVVVVWSLRATLANNFTFKSHFKIREISFKT